MRVNKTEVVCSGYITLDGEPISVQVDAVVYPPEAITQWHPGADIEIEIDGVRIDDPDQLFDGMPYVPTEDQLNDLLAQIYDEATQLAYDIWQDEGEPLCD